MHQLPSTVLPSTVPPAVVAVSVPCWGVNRMLGVVRPSSHSTESRVRLTEVGFV